MAAVAGAEKEALCPMEFARMIPAADDANDSLKGYDCGLSPILPDG